MSQETNEQEVNPNAPNVQVVIENSSNVHVEVTITIREAIQRTIDDSNVEGALGGRVIHPDGRTEEVLGDDSDALYARDNSGQFVTNEAGQRVDAPLPEGARVEVIKTTRGA